MHQWNRKHIFLPLSTAGPKVPFVSAEALLPQILDASCQEISTHVLCIGCIWVQSAKSPGSGLRWIFNRLVLPQNSTAFKRQTHNQFAWQMRFILLVWGPSLDKPLLRQSAKKTRVLQMCAREFATSENNTLQFKVCLNIWMVAHQHQKGWQCENGPNPHKACMLGLRQLEWLSSVVGRLLSQV